MRLDTIFLTEYLARNYKKKLAKVDEEAKVKPFHCMIASFIAERDKEDLPTISKDIEDCFKVGKAVSSENLLQMENDGLLVRIKDEDDSRKNIIKLTKKGEEFVAFNDKKINDIENSVLSNLTNKERDELFRVLEKIYFKLEEENEK